MSCVFHIKLNDPRKRLNESDGHSRFRVVVFSDECSIFAGVLFIIYNITVILTSLLSCFDYYRKDICPALKPNPKKSAKAQMWLLLLQPLHEEMLISI